MKKNPSKQWQAQLCITASQFKEWYEGLNPLTKELYDNGLICAGRNLPISGEPNPIQIRLQQKGYTGITSLDPFRETLPENKGAKHGISTEKV